MFNKEFSMKKMIILFLLSYTLFAQNITHTIPLALQKNLCDKLANNSNRCENGSTLTYSTHSKLSNDRLLVFVYLNEHVFSMYSNTKDSIAVVIDKQGNWSSTVGNNIISEDIDSIHQDPHGNIWIRTHWQIEGVSPSYYHSQNALSWKRTVLPKNRNVDCCFETVDKPIFLYNTLTLTFRDMNNKNVKSWVSTYKSSLSNNPIWQPTLKVPTSSIENSQESNWKVKKYNNKITFTNKHIKKTIFLPSLTKTNKTLYHIQVGAYIKNRSAKKVQKSLKNLPYYSQIIKRKKYYKLLIGEFTSTKKAKFILAKLKREQPNNMTIQKAFIFSSKP